MQRRTGQIILAFVAAALIGFGIWYAQNIQAQNIVSGVVSDPVDILSSTDGRTNVLLLGTGGEGHDGGDLTDSMLLISFDLSSKTAKMIAIPRDIWVPSLYAKINTAYYYGNKESEGAGRDKAKVAVSEILGVPIHYVLVLDFQGFVKAIDAVGGVDVQVEHSFDDYKYPIPGKETVEPESDRYEHVHFDAGTMHMDGATALKFARSRHALGDEGTDFARAARQEKIILAFRNQIFSAGTLLSSDTIGKLKESIMSSIDTDIGSAQQGSFAKLFLSLGNKDNITSITLTDQFKNPKITKEYGGQWVLIPAVSPDQVQAYVQAKLAE